MTSAASFLPLSNASATLAVSVKDDTKVFWFKFSHAMQVYSHPSGIRWDEIVFDLEKRFSIHDMNVDTVTTDYGKNKVNNKYSYGRSCFIGFFAGIAGQEKEIHASYIVPPNCKITIKRQMFTENEQRQIPTSVARRVYVEQQIVKTALFEDDTQMEEFANMFGTEKFTNALMPQTKKFHSFKR
jgi:hypothetical protein